MLTILFLIGIIIVFGKLLLFALKAAWGIIAIVCSVLFLPIILIVLVFCGLIVVAFPILIAVGIFAFAAAAK